MIEGRPAGRGALITGSSSGIGRAIALRLGAEGAEILCCDQRKSREPTSMTRQALADPTARAELERRTPPGRAWAPRAMSPPQPHSQPLMTLHRSPTSEDV